MMKLRILVYSIIILAALVACKDNSKLNGDQNTGEESSSSDKQIEAPILVNQHVHAFSDPAKQDTFRITLTGDSVQTATVTFEIHNSKGERIYPEQFAAIDLINYELPENADPAAWDNFILNRISTFFDEEHFVSPAIHSGMQLDSAYIDIEGWNDIKSNEASIGFYFLLGKEDGRWLAYSKSQQKVVLYFNCC